MIIRGRTLGVLALALTLALSIPCGAMAEEMITPAQDWKEMSIVGQIRWVTALTIGCKGGVTKAKQVLADEDSFKESPRFAAIMKKITEKCLIDSLDVVVAAVTEFYKDPANTYVSSDDAVDISILTMRGKQVDSQVREARSIGYESFMVVQKQQSKH